RWLRGDLPFSGGSQRKSVLQLSLRDEGRPDETHVLAFADFIPPIALSMFDRQTPGSSLTWMIEMLRDRYDDLGMDGWRVDAELLAARDGYTNQSVMLWGPRGEPVALSRQSMVVFGLWRSENRGLRREPPVPRQCVLARLDWSAGELRSRCGRGTSVCARLLADYRLRRPVAAGLRRAVAILRAGRVVLHGWLVRAGAGRLAHRARIDHVQDAVGR